MSLRCGPIPTLCFALALLARPTSANAQTPAELLLSELRAHCGKAYAGQLVDPQPVDSAIAAERLVMHVRSCGDTLRVPFHVGADRSRTWVLTETPSGLRLKHDHRHADGTADSVTQYGGDAARVTRQVDGSLRAEFAVDAYTSELLPASRWNVWTLELSATTFVYELRRTNSDRRFRVVFDFARAVPAPPAPWGAAP